MPRRKISDVQLEQLVKKGNGVCEIARILKVSKGAVSKRLKLLQVGITQNVTVHQVLLPPSPFSPATWRRLQENTYQIGFGLWAAINELAAVWGIPQYPDAAMARNKFGRNYRD